MPFTVNVVILFFVAFILLFISGFISVAELSFLSLKPDDINEIEKEKTSTDRYIKKVLKNPELFLATTLIVNNFTNIGFFLISAYSLDLIFDFSENPVLGFILKFVFLILFLLFFGEILPKIYARHNALKTAKSIAQPFYLIEKLFSPLSKLLLSSTKIISKSITKRKYNLSSDELSKVLELTSGESEEKEMLESIVKFYNKTTVEIMISRMDISALDIEAGFDEVINHVTKVGYSRIPVYSESYDNIKGILYVKDLLPHRNKKDDFQWQKLIRPAFFVPETKKIDDLLDEFRTNKVHLAIVVDEFGATSGIVTLEDILEEIVGEITDEFDKDDFRYVKLSDGSYIFEGKISLIDFFKITDLNEKEFEKLIQDIDTLAGLVLEIKGDFPEKREVLEYKKYRFQVLEVKNRRIMKVKFSFKNQLLNEDKEVEG